MFQDLRFGARVLLKNPGFTAVAVLSLALGVGANTAIFTVIDVLLLRKLPVANPERLVTLEQVFPDGRRQSNYAFMDYEQLQSLTQVFSGISAITWTDGFNVGVSGQDDRVDETQAHISVVTGNFFSVLGVNAQLGRTFSEDEDRAIGGSPVTVISDAYWEHRFGRAPDVIGRTLNLNGSKFDIIGVTSRGFSGDWVGWPTDFWIPVSMQYQAMPWLPPGPRGSRTQYKLIARLNPGVTIEQAQMAGEIVHQQLAKDARSGSGVSADARFSVLSASAGYSTQRDTFAQPLVILMTMVGAVLLVACANVANLMLARASAREQETAVRMAIGASRCRIVRQLLTESGLLAVMGCAVGLLFAWWGVEVLAMLARSGPVSSVQFGATSLELQIRPDGRILGFATTLGLFTVILFGLGPAFKASKVSIASSLARRVVSDSNPRGRFGLRRMLVIGQVAVSLVLLIGATLLARTLRNLKSEELGVDRDHVLLVWTLPGQTRLQGAALTSVFWTIQDRLSSLPGVVSASSSVTGLLTGASGGPLVRAESSSGGQEIAVDGSMTAGPRFFETIGQELVEGREFTRLDSDPARKVVIVNETLARRLFPGQSPLGQRLVSGNRNQGTPYEIVGVVSDAKYRTPRQESGLMTYWPISDGSRLPRLCWVVRAFGNAQSIAASVRQELRDIEPTLPVLKVNTVDEQLDALLFQDRLMTDLSAFFGVLAVLLACLGLYGVMSYTVTRRTNEIGVRLALGASPLGILMIVLRESLSLSLIGIVIGIPAALGTMRFLASRLFGVTAADPITIVAATSLIIMVAGLSSLVPAVRASRVDPIVALKYE